VRQQTAAVKYGTQQQESVFAPWQGDGNFSMVSLSNGNFMTGLDWRQSLWVWNERGEQIKHIRTYCEIEKMLRLRDGSLVIASKHQLKIYKL